MRIIAVMNQKGGVGKTTTSLNFSHALAMSGRKVTVIDIDPQSQLTMSYGIDQAGLPGISGAMLDGLSLEQVRLEARDNLHIVPAGLRLGEMENMTKGGRERGWMLSNVFKRSNIDDDFIIIDCPPSAGMLGMNCLFAADEVLAPVSGDYLGLHGVSRLVSILRHIEKALQVEKTKWLLVTRFNERRRLAREVVGKLKMYFPNELLATRIRENVALAESPSFGKSIFEYERKSKGAEDYLALAFEFLEGKARQ
jgi:chromosome partitioning protein